MRAARALLGALAVGGLGLALGDGGVSSLPSQLQPLKNSIDGHLGLTDTRNPLPGNRGIPQAGNGWGMSQGSGSSSGPGSSSGGGSSTPAVNRASALGDPILNGFDGRSFEYYGKVGAFYNVLSEKRHQLTMKLMPGHMWDHNGTYIEALGMQYQDHQVVVRMVEGALTVSLDNATLVMDPETHEVESVLGLERGEMMVLWQLHRPEYGSAVEITTDLLQVLMWETPAGTRDEGGTLQPAYLNFDISLLAPPAHGTMNGLIGETYDFLVDNVTHANDFEFHGKYPEAEYEMEDLFHHAHAQSLFGKSSAERRITLQEENAVFVTFPVRASGKGLVKARPQAQVAVPIEVTAPRMVSGGGSSSHVVKAALGRKGAQ